MLKLDVILTSFHTTMKSRKKKFYVQHRLSLESHVLHRMFLESILIITAYFDILSPKYFLNYVFLKIMFPVNDVSHI